MDDRQRRRARAGFFPARILALVVILVPFGCATPTLPLPPPSALTISPPDTGGLATVTGEVLPDAFVTCLNERTERGVLVRADREGRFELMIAAEPFDDLTVWQFVSADRGPPIHLTVPAPP